MPDVREVRSEEVAAAAGREHGRRSRDSRGRDARAPGRGNARFLPLAALAGIVLGGGIVLLGPPSALIGTLVVGAVWAILVRPEAGVLGFIAVASLLPFGVIPVRVVFSPTLVDALLTALLAAWLYRAIRRGVPLVGSPLDGLIVLYLGLALVSLVLGLNYSVSPERLRLFMKSINSTLLFFSVLNCVRTPAALERSTIALMLGGTAAALVALAIQFLPEPTAVEVLSSLGPLGYPTGQDVLRPIADTSIPRAIGTSIDPNVLGGLLMMASAMMVGQLLSGSPLLPRRYLGPMLAIAVAALLLTQSRSALGGLVVATVFLGTIRDRRLLLVLVVAAVALPFIPQAGVLLGRLQSGLAFGDRAAAMRLDEYANALKSISMYPWFGIGFGESPSIDLFVGVSSIYLLIGQEMGLVGLASFLGILGVLAWLVGRRLREGTDGRAKDILGSLGAALLAAAATGLLDQYYVNIMFPHMIALFWLYVGLAVVAVKIAREEAACGESNATFAIRRG